MDYKFENWLEEFNLLSSIGENEQGGIDRLAFSPPDLMVRTEILNRACGLQLKTDLDNANNLWLTKEGTDPSLPPLIIGSHMDSVPNGGRFDGTLGVLAGLQVLRRLQRDGTEHRRSVELVVFSCEESSRFNLSTIGSKLLTRKLKPEEMDRFRDNTGITAADCLTWLKMSPYQLQERFEHLRSAYGFIEMHIEQGPVLEATHTDIGIVECIAAPIRLKLNFRGCSDHSGACPMDLRHDAFAAAAEMTLEIERLGREESIHKSVATVTRCSIPHEALNVVPGETEIYVDIRGIHRDSVERIHHGVQAFAKHIEETRGVRIEEALLANEQPVALNQELMEVIRRKCEDCGLSYRVMPSGAGHDAMNIAPYIPTAMIFIPCVDGISHNLREYVTEENLRNSLQILYEVVLDICR